MACQDDPRLELVGETGTGAGAVEAASELRPDVMVLDLGLPDMDGLEVVRRIRASGQRPRFLILTARTDARAVFEAQAAGVDGFVEKTGAIGRIGELVRAVADGKAVFSEAQDRTALEELRRHVLKTREASRAAGLLTDREISVLRLIAEGRTTRQIARQLSLSERTVEAHVGKVYRKLSVRSRIQAVSLASSLGLLPEVPAPEPDAPTE
jgi:DNA-binding NarL/FixJ family response regulator